MVEAREMVARNRGVQMEMLTGTTLRKVEQRTGGRRSGTKPELGTGEEQWGKAADRFQTTVVKMGESKKATLNTKGREVREKYGRKKSTGRQGPSRGDEGHRTPSQRPEGGGGGGDATGNGILDPATSEAAATSAATPTSSGAEDRRTSSSTTAAATPPAETAAAAPQPARRALPVRTPDEGAP